MNWSADVMTDPERDHRLHVELMEDDEYRARLYQDESGEIMLQFYDLPHSSIPADWLVGIVARFRDDLSA